MVGNSSFPPPQGLGGGTYAGDSRGGGISSKEGRQAIAPAMAMWTLRLLLRHMGVQPTPSFMGVTQSVQTNQGSTQILIKRNDTEEVMSP